MRALALRQMDDGCPPLRWASGCSVPALPGRAARRDYEYKRCGTANVFCGVEPKAGHHFTKVTPTRSSAEFADYLLKIAIRYPAADTIHLVMDNLSTHTRKAMVERFGEKTERLAVADSAGSPHSQTWKLAESGGDGGRHVQPPVPRQTTNREISQPCANGRGHGTAASIRTRLQFSGSSHVGKREEHFTTQSHSAKTDSATTL